MNSYPIAYESLDVGGNVCWIAEDPTLPGPYAIGDSPTDAFEKFEKAMEVWTRLRAEEQAGGLVEVVTANQTSGEAKELELWSGAGAFTFRPVNVSGQITVEKEHAVG